MGRHIGSMTCPGGGSCGSSAGAAAVRILLVAWSKVNIECCEPNALAIVLSGLVHWRIVHTRNRAITAILAIPVCIKRTIVPARVQLLCHQTFQAFIKVFVDGGIYIVVRELQELASFQLGHGCSTYLQYMGGLVFRHSCQAHEIVQVLFRHYCHRRRAGACLGEREWLRRCAGGLNGTVMYIKSYGAKQ
jgi:hypothetical protein